MNIILCIGMVVIIVFVDYYFIEEYQIEPHKLLHISYPFMIIYGLLCYGIRGMARNIIKYKKDRVNEKKVSFVNKEILLKKILKIFLWLLLVFILIIYINISNDGTLRYTVISHNYSPVDIINCYTEVEFPEDISVNKFCVNKEGDSNILNARLRIESRELDEIIPEDKRNYKELNSDDSKEYFEYRKTKKVRKWSKKEQRNIIINTLKYENGIVTIDINVDKLNWLTE